MSSKLLVPRIIWFAMFLSTLIYLFILDATTLEGEPSWQALLMVLSVAGVATGGASLVGPRLILTRDPTTPDEGSREEVMARYMARFILAMALAEAVAIYGLILGFEGAPLSVVLSFFVATWILMLIRFPTEAKLVEGSAAPHEREGG